MCVCWCACPPCTPPLLAGVCGVAVIVWAGVPAAPRHSWLGCRGVGVCVRAPLVPRHSWLGCAVWMCVFGFGFPLRPATPGWVVRRGCVCLGSGFRLYPATPGWAVWCGGGCLGPGFGCAPPLLACVWGLGVFVCAPVSAAPNHSWRGCWGVCMLVCVLPSYPATPGWGVRCGFGCLGSGFGCAPPLLAGVLGCACLCACSLGSPQLLAGVCGVGVCAWARVLVVHRHSWLGCRGVCVLVCALRLYPATPGWGVRCGCVCLCSGFSCAPPLLAGVLGCACLCACSPCAPPLLAGARGVGVCVCVRVSAAPRHSWLGCWGVCVLVWALPLYPATPDWGVRCRCVCLGSGFGCAPPLLAGVLGCACPPCTPPLLAGVCGVGVCAWARFSAAPRHSWLGGWGLCVLMCPLRLSPATPGWGVRCRCVRLCSGFGCAPPLLAGLLGCVCAGLRVPVVPLPLLDGVCGVDVCLWARVSAAPRHYWLGCWVVRVLVFTLHLYPTTLGWGLRRGCVCSGSGFGCAPPLLAGVFGCVCAGVRAPLVPCRSWLGCALSVCVLGLRFWLRPATAGWGVWCVGWLMPGTCSCAVVRCELCALPGFAAPVGRCGLAPVLAPWLWPAACLSGGPRGPALVRRASSSPVALGAPVGFPVAVVPFPTPGACACGFTGWLHGARGRRPRIGLIVPASGPRRGRGAGLAPRRTHSRPRDGVVPGGPLRRRSWAACAAVFCGCGSGH